MKKLWNKLPAWLKSILQGLILLFPVLMVNQVIIFTNLQSNSPIAWGLPSVLFSLFIYWKLVKRLDTNKLTNDIKIDLQMELGKRSSWYQILGLMLLTYSSITLVYMIASIENTQQQQLMEAFKNTEPLLAIPLLFALALHAGIVEEITFRSFMQNTLQRKYAQITSYLIIGLLFAVSHLLPIELIVPYALVSIAYSYVADKRKSIGLNMFAHFLFDFLIFMGIYFDLIEIGVFSWANLTTTIILLVGGLVLIFLRNTESKPDQESSLSVG